MLPSLNSVSLSVNQRASSEKYNHKSWNYLSGSKVAIFMNIFEAHFWHWIKVFKTVTSYYGKYYEQSDF